MAIDALVSIDLDQIPTQDLIDELKARKGFNREELLSMEAYALIDQLEAIGCPAHIVTQLNEWDSQPVNDRKMLEAWKEQCNP